MESNPYIWINVGTHVEERVWKRGQVCEHVVHAKLVAIKEIQEIFLLVTKSAAFSWYCPTQVMKQIIRKSFT